VFQLSLKRFDRQRRNHRARLDEIRKERTPVAHAFQRAESTFKKLSLLLPASV